MTARRAAWIAWGGATLCIVLTSVTVILMLVTGHIPGEDTPATGIVEQISPVLFGVMGAVVAANRPRNPIGWILVAMSLVWSVQGLSGYYALYAFDEMPSLPGADFASVVYGTGWALPLLGLPPVFALFPTGTLPSRRWTWILVGLVVPIGAIVTMVALALPHGGRRLLTDIESVEMVAWTDAVIGVLLVSTVLLVAGGVVSLGVRFKRAAPTERGQIKFLILAGLGLVGSALTSNLLNLPTPLEDFIDLVTFAGVPVAIAAAILRYRLYDIDRIINRTIVYALVTGSLACVYLVVVLIPPWLGRDRGNEPPFVVAASTLVIVALFRPVRRRVQGAVDRRFYRSRYDAGRTIDAFGARLREETDLDELTDDLVSVVRRTMQPEHVSVWLVPTEVAK